MVLMNGRVVRGRKVKFNSKLNLTVFMKATAEEGELQPRGCVRQPALHTLKKCIDEEGCFSSPSRTVCARFARARTQALPPHTHAHTHERKEAVVKGGILKVEKRLVELNKYVKVNSGEE